jgi:hypothetical protein
MNRRKEIRQHIIELLSTYFVGIPVIASRRSALDRMNLPCIVITIESETSEVIDTSRRESRKTAELSIEILTNVTEDDAPNVLDEWTGKIETMVHIDDSWANLIDYCVLKNTELVYVRDGELELTIARMQFEVNYFARFLPEVEFCDPKITDFNGVTLKIVQKKVSHVG